MASDRWLKRLLYRRGASELFPVEAYDPASGLFALARSEGAALGMCFIGAPLVGLDAAVVSQLEGAFQQDMPPETVLQISVLCSSGVDALIDQYVDLRLDAIGDPDNGMSPHQRRTLRDLTERYARFLRKSAIEPPLDDGMVTKIQLLLISIVVPVKRFSVKTQADVQAACARMRSALENVGLNLSAVDAAQYQAIINGMLHMGRRVKRRYDVTEPINRQLLDIGDRISANDERVAINDDTFIRSLSVQHYPEETSIGAMSYLLGDPMGGLNQLRDPVLITLNVAYPDDTRKRAAIRAKQTIVNKQAIGDFANWDQRFKAKRESFAALERALNDGQLPLEAWLNICVFSPTEQRCADSASAIESYARQAGFGFAEDRYMHLPFLLCALPLCTVTGQTERDLLYRYQTMPSSTVAHVAPILGDWAGNGRSELAHLMLSRRGQVMNVDLWETTSASNFLIAADTGAGKSVAAQHLLVMSELARGHRVYVIDHGRSFDAITRMLGGTYVEFTEDRTFNLNPFAAVTDIKEDIEGIVALLEVMVAHGESLDGLHRAALAESTLSVYQRWGEETTLSQIAAELTERGIAQSDRRIEDLGLQLNMWCGDGPYARWFEAGESVSFKNNLVVLELEELNGKEQLQRVVLYALMNQIARDMYLRQRGRRRDRIVVFIDEGWEHFTQPASMAFVEHAYRRFRKYGGAIGMSMQNIADAYQSNATRAVANLAQFKFLMRQSPEAIEMARREGHLAIGAWGFEMLKSVRTQKGQFSEAFIAASDMGQGVGRLVLDRFFQLLYTTDPAETPVLRELRRQGLSITQSLDVMVAAERADMEPLAYLAAWKERRRQRC